MSAAEIFNAAVRREFQFLTDEFDFLQRDETKADKWGDLRHRYELGEWFIAPVYNEYGKQRCQEPIKSTLLKSVPDTFMLCTFMLCTFMLCTFMLCTFMLC